MAWLSITVRESREPRLWQLTTDLVFEEVFGRPGRERLMLFLLNAVLRRGKSPLLVRARVVRRVPRIMVGSPQVAAYDVTTCDAEGVNQLVQVQATARNYSLVGAMFHYEELVDDWILERKPDLGRLRPAVLALTGGTMLAGHEHVYSRLTLKDELGGRLVGAPLEFHCVELGKFDLEQASLCTTSEDRWLHLLRYGHHYLGEASLPLSWATEPGLFKVMAEFKAAVARLEKAADTASGSDEGLDEGPWESGPVSEPGSGTKPPNPKGPASEPQTPSPTPDEG